MCEGERFMGRGRPDNPLEFTPEGTLYLGSAIRQMRQQRGLGLRKLAALVPYHPGAFSNLENNRATVSSRGLTKIAEALGVPEDELTMLPLHPRLSKDKTILNPRVPSLSEQGKETVLLPEESQLLVRLTNALGERDIPEEGKSVLISMIDAGIRALYMTKERSASTYPSTAPSSNKEDIPVEEQGNITELPHNLTY